MNPLIEVNIAFYWEISNSLLYDGEVGYAATKYEGVKNLDAIDDTFIENLLGNVADMAGVSRENVRLISREEYDMNTEDDEDDEDVTGTIFEDGID